MVTEHDERVTASLAMLGADDAEPGQNLAGFRLRLSRLRTDPAEAARIETLAAEADQNASEDADAASREVQVGDSGDLDDEEILQAVERLIAWAEAELARGGLDATLDASRREQVRADQLLVEAVLKEGLDGPRYRASVDEMIRYAVPVLQHLLASGQMVRSAIRLGRPPVPQDAWLDFTQDDRQEFAWEMVAYALPVFTEAVFVQRRWSPARGASLKTYFVNACVLQFPRLQKQWLYHRRFILPVGLELDLDAFAPAPDPATTVALRDEVHRMLSQIGDRQLRKVVVLRGAGWTLADAAREAGLTTKAAEGRLARLRKNLKGEQARQAS